MAKEVKRANQYTSDEREQLMWDIYITKLSKGIENAYQSAIEAGYSEDHSRNITLQGWFKERESKLKRTDMLSKSEKKLSKTLDYEVEEIDDKGNSKIKTDLLKIQVDVAKHITSTLGKEEGYSTRQEMTGKDGKDLIPDKQSIEKAEEAINSFLGKATE